MGLRVGIEPFGPEVAKCNDSVFNMCSYVYKHTKS